MSGAGGDVVVGVAVAIPQPHAKVLSSWRDRIGDPVADLVFPHVTLLPPTSVPAGSLDDIEAHLAGAAKLQEPFDMHLAGTGTFRPTSPVVYVQIATGVAQCEVLESAVRSGPLARSLDFPYHPHVTVAHGVTEEQLDEAYEGLSGFVARFAVDSFVLYTRDDDGQWLERTRFPLGGHNDAPTG